MALHVYALDGLPLEPLTAWRSTYTICNITANVMLLDLWTRLCQLDASESKRCKRRRRA